MNIFQNIKKESGQSLIEFVVIFVFLINFVTISTDTINIIGQKIKLEQAVSIAILSVNPYKTDTFIFDETKTDDINQFYFSLNASLSGNGYVFKENTQTTFEKDCFKFNPGTFRLKQDIDIPRPMFLNGYDLTSKVDKTINLMNPIFKALYIEGFPISSQYTRMIFLGTDDFTDIGCPNGNYEVR